MRRIKILTSCAGDNFSFRRGKEYDVSDETAKTLVKAGFAEDLKKVKGNPIDSVSTDEESEDSELDSDSENHQDSELDQDTVLDQNSEIESDPVNEEVS